MVFLKDLSNAAIPKQLELGGKKLGHIILPLVNFKATTLMKLHIWFRRYGNYRGWEGVHAYKCVDLKKNVYNEF